MKYVKILGLLAVAAAALMAFAASASATTVTTTTGGSTDVTHIHAVSEEGHVILHSPLGDIQCASTATGDITAQGAGVTASGPLAAGEEGLSFTGCTEGWHVTVISGGTLEVHATSGHNGTLTSNNAEVSATVGGITCVYKTTNTDIGTVTGGNPATLDISASIPINTAKSSIFCGTAPSGWTGFYKTTSALYIAP